MSKQISFFQSAIDTSSFLRVIEKKGGRVVFNGELVPPSLAESAILKKTESHKRIVQVIPHDLFIEELDKIPRGMFIEFAVCSSKNALSRTYEVGRLYLTQTDMGLYTGECLRLYESLSRYIRKTYRYEKVALGYFAPDFWEKYQSNYYCAVRAGVPVRRSSDNRLAIRK